MLQLQVTVVYLVLWRPIIQVSYQTYLMSKKDTKWEIGPTTRMFTWNQLLQAPNPELDPS